MKSLLIPLALIAGNALACPADGSGKDAMAPAANKQAAVAKATAPAVPTAAAPVAAVTAGPATKVVAKPVSDVRKSASL